MKQDKIRYVQYFLPSFTPIRLVTNSGDIFYEYLPAVVLQFLSKTKNGATKIPIIMLNEIYEFD